MATTHLFDSQKHIFINIKKTYWIGFGREKKENVSLSNKKDIVRRQFGLFAQLE